MSIPRFVIAATFLSLSLLQAQQQDAAPPDLNALAKEIAALELKQKQSKLSEKSLLMAKIQAASASGSAAANFYADAVEAVQFEGKPGKGEAFQEWRKSHEDLLRSKEMQTAVQLHLKYLLLAIQRKDMDKPEAQLPALMDYVGDLIAADDLFVLAPPPPVDGKKKKAPSQDERTALLDKPLGQSVFSQWLRLEPWLPEAKLWEAKPGDVAGILEKNIRPLLREAKSPNLIQTWDLQMKVEADRITTGRSDYQADSFNTVTRPQLLFKRAQDMILLGQPNRGLGEIMVLVRTYPTHPDFAQWLGKIRELIKPGSAQTSPPAAPDSAP